MFFFHQYIRFLRINFKCQFGVFHDVVEWKLYEKKYSQLQSFRRLLSCSSSTRPVCITAIAFIWSEWKEFMSFGHHISSYPLLISFPFALLIFYVALLAFVFYSSWVEIMTLNFPMIMKMKKFFLCSSFYSDYFQSFRRILESMRMIKNQNYFH